jgi:hypothetical protein
MRFFPAIYRIVVLAALAALAWIPPDAIAAMPPVCVFKALLGTECFGCGMTRALSALLHGDIASALAYNRLVLFALPALALIAVVPEALQRAVLKRRVA